MTDHRSSRDAAEDVPGCFSNLLNLSLPSLFQARGKRTSRSIQSSGTVPQSQLKSAALSDQNADSTSEPLEHPPTYSELSTHQFDHDALATINERVDELSSSLRELSLKINGDPELEFEEYHAHDNLTAFMESHGFTVARHYLGLETAWRAEFSHGHGGRVMGVNSEMDALPAIGHACGHNLIAIAGVAVALALKAVLEKHNISGKVVLLGTPAEEGGGGKKILLERGGYEDMDACVMCHPGAGESRSTGTGPSLATEKLDVEYFGHTAHAAAAPWEGQNALDAAFLAYSAVSVLRQQIKPDHRVHGIVQGKNWAANIIPDYATMQWIARAPSAAEAKALLERVKNCVEAAGTATACRVKLKVSPMGYADLRQNKSLAEAYRDTASRHYGLSLTDAAGAIGGSTDFGNVSYDVPSLHPMYAIPTQPNGGNHTVLFAEAARSVKAHHITLDVAKSLAFTGFRVIHDDAFFAKVSNSR
ncbi:amidohydrolase [Sistotremastrum suecicum HHB10207 ss-3]|uniref:Amidohydrolase n=1 Tax=Sistotremastrum suecicum HHB10207 ss-3 TaxID=1314776 RepID=A0A166CR71_9AGAM|nr:amidohydrolase [Sistotremastrum suecicum HHB10207 ss-3]